MQLWRIQVSENSSSVLLVFGTTDKLDHGLYYNAWDVENIDKYRTRRQARAAARWYAAQDELPDACVHDILDIPDRA